jgi:hypothetical protein
MQLFKTKIVKEMENEGKMKAIVYESLDLQMSES